MPKSKVDPDSFQAWKESHPVTLWVLSRLQARALLLGDLLSQELQADLTSSPSERAERQPRQAHQQGRCDGLMSVVTLDYADVREETDDEIKEMESKT